MTIGLPVGPSRYSFVSRVVFIFSTCVMLRGLYLHKACSVSWICKA